MDENDGDASNAKAGNQNFKLVPETEPQSP